MFMGRLGMIPLQNMLMSIPGCLMSLRLVAVHVPGKHRMSLL